MSKSVGSTGIWPTRLSTCVQQHKTNAESFDYRDLNNCKCILTDYFLEQEADANAEQVALNSGKFDECNHAASSVGSLSVMLGTLCFIKLSLDQLLS